MISTSTVFSSRWQSAPTRCPDRHTVGIGRYQGKISFPMQSGPDVILEHSKDDDDGFTVKINIKTMKAVWATGAGQDMAPDANTEGTGESKHVATTTQGHVVVSGDTELKARVPEDMGRLTLLNGDTGELVWERSFTNASSFTGVRSLHTDIAPTTLLCVHITSCAPAARAGGGCR